MAKILSLSSLTLFISLDKLTIEFFRFILITKEDLKLNLEVMISKILTKDRK